MEITNTPELIGSTQTETPEAPEATKSESLSPGRAALRRFYRDKRAVISLAVILFVSIGSFVFPPLYQHIGPIIPGGVTGTQPIGPALYHSPTYQQLTYSDAPSTVFPLGNKNAWVYPLGADTDGRDILARLMAGINVSIIIALCVEVFDVALGIFFGALAGFFGGWLDMVLARFTDIMFAFPGLLLIILIGATLGPIFDKVFGAGNGRIILLVLAIGFLAWPLMMRYVRGQTLQLKEQQYIEAARTVGSSNRGIIVRHIVPNLLSVVIVAATLDILGTINLEAGISLLGVGIQAPTTSLGLMISAGLGTIYTQYTELLWPALTLVVLIVAFAFLGDGVRDAFDPRLKD